MPESPSPFITVGEVAALLRVPRSCVYTWTSRVGPGAIPRYKAGRQLVFIEKEVLDWFTETHRVGTGPLARVRRSRSRRDGQREVRRGHGPQEI